jgi:hypothetical protein
MSVLEVARTGCRGLEFRAENIPFDERPGPDQRNDIAHFLLREDGRGLTDEGRNQIRKAMNDHLSPDALYAKWRSADVAGLLELVDKALRKAIGPQINSLENP